MSPGVSPCHFLGPCRIFRAAQRNLPSHPYNPSDCPYHLLRRSCCPANCRIHYRIQNLFHYSLYFDHFKDIFSNPPGSQHNVLILTSVGHFLCSYKVQYG